MKKHVIAGVLSAVVIATAGLACGASRQEPGDMFLRQMTKVLDLTSDQQTQIKALLATEHQTEADLVQQETALRLQLRQAEWGSTLDEASVTATAASLAQIEQELTLSRVKTRFQINALLTAAQRTLAQKLEPVPGHRPEAPPTLP